MLLSWRFVLSQLLDDPRVFTFPATQLHVDRVVVAPAGRNAHRVAELRTAVRTGDIQLSGVW